ncbi:hypothetical protein HanRHA438_Chr00c34g0855591 [Helianthus annuus]|nr:hypothetical protein HanRHA438_Chr00c34g0855591 [Helianthus annuus]
MNPSHLHPATPFLPLDVLTDDGFPPAPVNRQHSSPLTSPHLTCSSLLAIGAAIPATPPTPPPLLVPSNTHHLHSCSLQLFMEKTLNPPLQLFFYSIRGPTTTIGWW